MRLVSIKYDYSESLNTLYTPNLRKKQFTAI